MARTSRKIQNKAQMTVSQSPKVWKTVLYIRLSVEDNGKDSDSIENQKALLEEYVANHTYLQQTDTFIDNGYTGTNFDRPAFQRLIEAVQSKKVDCILVKDLSRLGRNYIETSQFIEKICPFYGLRFISVNDNYDTASVTGEGQLSASLSNIINDYYAKDISRKVTSALQSKMERGDYIGNYAPHGYLKDPKNKNHLIVDPETAPVIRQIFQWRAEGISYMGINKRLNDAGIPSPSQYKFDRGIKTNNNVKKHTILWNKHMVTEILKNVVYIGHLVQKKGSQCLYGGIPYHVTSADEWIVVKNTHEPLISEDLFEKVQQVNVATTERTKANSGKYAHLPKEKNIYQKKFTCAECGATMKLTRSFNRKGDRVYHTFKCPTYAEHGTIGCFDIKIRKRDLDEAVFVFIKSQMKTFIDINQQLILTKQEEPKLNQDEIKNVKQKIERKSTLLSDMYVDFKEGLLSREAYIHHRKALAEEIEVLKAQLPELESSKKEILDNRTIWKELTDRFYSATQISPEIVDIFIKSMKLHKDGSLDIQLNYTNEMTNEEMRKDLAK